eukprot:TRINITY_DN984_c0_g1_i1.p1 TRINITY_DN984_c0_g1~~TRINITY_DN984_c0_g1_i1.p1  ORF type:complete len:619 (+),score=62.44 TRINITY_DN984_c0_g1_i1:81-1937(+)
MAGVLKLPRGEKHKLYRRGCCECLLLAIYMFLFLHLTIVHTSIANVSMMARTMKVQLLEHQFGNHSYTVNSIKEQVRFWQWLEEAVLPVVAVQEDVLGHTLPREDWGYVADYNKIVGGIRLIQERSQYYACSYSHSGKCYPEETVSLAPFGYPSCKNATYPCYDTRLYEDVIDLAHNEGFSVDPYVGKFEFWLDSLEPRKDLDRRLKYLEDRHWIDRQTKTITVEILSTNQQYEPLMSVAIFKFHLDRTGYIHRDLHVDTISSNPYSSYKALKVTLEMIYIVSTLMIFLRVCIAAYSHYKSVRSVCRACALVLRKHWHDIVNVAAAIALICLFIDYLPSVQNASKGISELHRPETLAHNGSNADAWLTYHHELAEVEKKVEYAVAEIISMHRIAVFALFGLLFRFLAIWESIPAMSTVILTLRRATPQLVALAAASVSLLCLYAGMGVIAFGAELNEFSSMTNAIPSTALIVVAAEADLYEKQKEVDDVMATLWFWSLIGLLFIVMLNLTLGVLVNAASASHAEDRESLTLAQQTRMTLAHYTSKAFGRIISGQEMNLSSRSDLDSVDEHVDIENAPDEIGSHASSSQESIDDSGSHTVPDDDHEMISRFFCTKAAQA